MFISIGSQTRNVETIFARLNQQDYFKSVSDVRGSYTRTAPPHLYRTLKLVFERIALRGPTSLTM